MSKDNIPENLFEVLPFHCEDLSKEEYRPYACVTYIPGPVHHQLSKACRKAGVNLVTMSGTKLKDILCSKNTTRHDPASKPGIYELQCPCSDKAKYIGQTTRSITTQAKEHKKAAVTGNWKHSGISAHKEHCTEQVEWENPKIITNMSHKNKKKLNFDLKVREALEIRRRNSGPGHGLNEDFGSYVKSPTCNVVFHQLDSG